MAKRAVRVNRHRLLQFCCVLALLLLLAAILLSESARGLSALTKERAALTTYAPRVRLEGYLFRDETVLSGTSAGVVQYLVEDGATVAKGQTVALLYPGEFAPEEKHRIEEIYAEIADLEKTLSAQSGPWQAAYTEAYAAMMAAGAAGHWQEAALAAERVLEALERASVEEGGSYAELAVKARLENLHAELEEVLPAPQEIAATANGVFYRGIDRYEPMFGTKTVEGLTATDLAELLADPSLGWDGIGKTVNNDALYLALPIAAEALSLYRVGEAYCVCFSGAGVELSMTVHALSYEEGEASALLILYGEQAPAALLERRQEVSVQLPAHSGIAVPRSALYQEGDELFVFTEQERRAVKRRVKLLWEGDGVCLLEPTEEEGYLREGEAVLITTRRIYEGMAIRS